VVGEQLQPVDKILSPGWWRCPAQRRRQKEIRRNPGHEFLARPGKNSTTKWSGLHYFIKHNLPIRIPIESAPKTTTQLFGEEQVPIPQTTTPDF